MRTILFLLLALCIAAPGISQRPSQKEIEAQKQVAIREAKQQVVDLKKDIAKAKVAGEDPESIKEMEKQLATLENMVAMLGNTNFSAKPRVETFQPTKTAEPKYVSPFTPIVLKQPVSIPTEKQATDQLYWYRGKKIDANTLITTTGLIVRYDKTNHRLIIQPDKKGDTTEYYNLLNTLSQTQKLKNDYVIRMDKLPNNFFMYPEIKRAYEEYNFISTRLYKTAQNTIDLPTVQSFIDLERVLNQLIHGLDQFIKNLPNTPTIEMPPVRPNSLCYCNANDANKIYQKSLEGWVQQFWNDELQIIHKVIGIFHLRHSIKQKSSIYVDPPNFKETMHQAMYKALLRMRYKLIELLNNYDKGNVDVEDGLVWAALVLRNHLEVGVFSGPEIDKVFANEDINLIKERVFSDIFDRQIKNWKASRNFIEVFNYSRYISHEYNKKTLDDSYNINENFFNTWMEGLKDYNRFTLSISIKFEYQMISEDGPLMIATGVFESDKIITSLGIEDCLLNLRITDANYRDRSNIDEEKLKIHLNVKSGSREYIPHAAFAYSGPSIIGMQFPRFKLDFCGNESEVKLDLLTYSLQDIQKHKNDDISKVFTVDMLAYANKMFQGLMKTHSNLNELIKDAGTMMNMNSSALPASTGNPVLDQMNMDYLMNKKRYDLQYAVANSAHTEKSIINLGTLNPKGTPTIISPKPFDLADPNDPDKNVRITYAYITLELTHTPK
jgi:hypothetical protein